MVVQRFCKKKLCESRKIATLTQVFKSSILTNQQPPNKAQINTIINQNVLKFVSSSLFLLLIFLMF